MLYSSEETRVKLDLFTSRHKMRLLEMLHDISPPVICRTIDLLAAFQQFLDFPSLSFFSLTILFRSGFLDPNETQIVINMINCIHPMIRESVANFISTSVLEPKGTGGVNCTL
jgi:hypothetical protein